MRRTRLHAPRIPHNAYHAYDCVVWGRTHACDAHASEATCSLVTGRNAPYVMVRHESGASRQAKGPQASPIRAMRRIWADGDLADGVTYLGKRSW